MSWQCKGGYNTSYTGNDQQDYTRILRAIWMCLKIIKSPNMKQQINHGRHIESNPWVFCQASWRSLYQQAVWTALSQLPFDTQKIRKMMWQMAFDEIYWLCQDTKAVIEGLIIFNCLVVGIKQSYRLRSTGSLGGASLQGFDWPIPSA